MHQLRPWASSKDWCQLWPSLERLWVVWLILVIETIWTLNSNISCQAMFITALGVSGGLETPTTFIITSSGADRFYPLRYFYSPCLPLKMVNKYWQNPSGQSRDTWVEHRSGRKKMEASLLLVSKRDSYLRSLLAISHQGLLRLCENVTFVCQTIDRRTQWSTLLITGQSC